MEQQQPGELMISNHKSMVKGLEFAEAFGHAAERAVDNYRLTGPANTATDDQEQEDS